MSLLGRLGRAAIRDAVRAPRLSRHVSRHGVVDEWELADLKRAAPVFREALETPVVLDDGTLYEPTADLHDSIFLGAHAPGESEARPAEEVRPSHRRGAAIYADFIATEAARDAKPFTEGSVLGAAAFARGAIEEYDKIVREQEAAQADQKLHEQEQRLEQVMEDLEAARAGAKQAHDAGQPIPADVAQEVKDLTAAREAIAGELAQMPVPDATAVGAQVAEAGRDRAQAWSALAGIGGDALRHTTADEAWALTEQWMAIPDFQELCRLIGRVSRDIRSRQARHIPGGSDSVVGIELGNNLTNVLPSELARLGNPLTRTSFLKDYVDEGLLQFETEGEEPASNGPGVLCLDASGSMQGRKLLEAKALVVGFARLMHLKRRDAVVIVFNGRVQWHHHFPKDKPLDMAALLALASVEATGGTTGITAAVALARTYVERSPAFKRADVLVVTDGQVGFTSGAAAVRDSFRETGVRSLGVAIAHEPAPGGWLLSFCDDAISVAALTEATGDIVRAVS